MDHTIVLFEIPANNPERLSGFYKDLFGWKFEKMRIPAMGVIGAHDYWMIGTKTGQDNAGANGGMMKKMAPDQGPVNYVVVESVDDFSKRLQSLGGKILMPKTVIPNNLGAIAIATDPEGNRFGLWESSQ